MHNLDDVKHAGKDEEGAGIFRHLSQANLRLKHYRRRDMPGKVFQDLHAK